ncbi:MAG: mitochondrial fission ELM1 family protein, partial [Candidatus Omnitrophica bacterium]|nr:mitochondrial fission ELM1 family protein [Candidatus Omnitrophota bacterium]
FGLTEESVKAHERAFGDIVISCGASTEASNIILSGENSARSAFIQKPQCGTGCFTVVLAPGHDRLSHRGNALRISGALSGSLTGNAAVPARDLKLSRMGLLIGGSSRHSQWGAQDLKAVLEGVKGLSQAREMEVFLTTSRRTDPGCEKTLEDALGAWPQCSRRLIVSRENPPGAYDGILSDADFLVVTADSISMISEAVSTGKPVVVVWPAGKPGGSNKLTRFIDEMAREGGFVAARPDELEQAIGAVGNHQRGSDSSGSNDRVLKETARRLLSGDKRS